MVGTTYSYRDENEERFLTNSFVVRIKRKRYNRTTRDLLSKVSAGGQGPLKKYFGSPLRTHKQRETDRGLGTKSEEDADSCYGGTHVGSKKSIYNPYKECNVKLRIYDTESETC